MTRLRDACGATGRTASDGIGIVRAGITNEQTSAWGVARPRRPRAAWRHPLAMSLLFLLLSLFHGVVMAGATGTAVPLAEPVEFAAHDRIPAHAVDCAVDLEAAAPSASVIRAPWIALPPALPASAPAWEPPTVGPPAAAAIGSPGERRALLQIFRI